MLCLCYVKKKIYMYLYIYSKASQIAVFCIAISRIATKWRHSHSDYCCTGSDVWWSSAERASGLQRCQVKRWQYWLGAWRYSYVIVFIPRHSTTTNNNTCFIVVFRLPTAAFSSQVIMASTSGLPPSGGRDGGGGPDKRQGKKATKPREFMRGNMN